MQGVISTPHREATEAGKDIFSRGGNAVDAALAAAAVLTVVLLVILVLTSTNNKMMKLSFVVQTMLMPSRSRSILVTMEITLQL